MGIDREETYLKDKRQNGHNLITFGLGIERKNFGLLPSFSLIQLSKKSNEEEEQGLQVRGR